MEIKILSPLWGHEHLPIDLFCKKVKEAGYDGIDTWIPEDRLDKKKLFDYLERNQMEIVSHQHRAEGKTFKHFRRSFLKNLRECAEPMPLLINSHTGRDFFSFEQNLCLIDDAADFSAKTGIQVVHETHRGRFGYSPQMIEPFFRIRPEFKITADLSHWVCVTESMLENFTGIVDEALTRSLHIHSRVGFEQGPQISDPRASEWKYAVDGFIGWWDKIISNNRRQGVKIMPISTEFGPEPYMPKIPNSIVPMVDQFEINCYMKEMIFDRYAKQN